MDFLTKSRSTLESWSQKLWATKSIGANPAEGAQLVLVVTRLNGKYYVYQDAEDRTVYGLFGDRLPAYDESNKATTENSEFYMMNADGENEGVVKPWLVFIKLWVDFNWIDKAANLKSAK